MAHLSQTHLNAGDKAPEFSSFDQDGNPVSLKDFRGKKLALFFYPKDNTPGCTKEVCNLRDNFEELTRSGYELLGVSADTAKRHQNFIQKFGLPFPLIVDTEKEVIRAYGVWGKKKFMGREYEGILRTTFIIDEDGIIDRIIEKVTTTNHAAQILGL